MTQTWLPPSPTGDSTLVVDATGGSEVVYLPAGFASLRRQTVRRTDGSGNSVTVRVPSGGKINGVVDATLLIGPRGSAAFTAFDGNAWVSDSSSVDSAAVVDGSLTAADLNIPSVAAAVAADPASTSTYAPLNGMWRIAPANFSHWRTALANVRNGTGNARILCVGDSTTFGTGGTDVSIPNKNSWTTALTSLINSYLGPAAIGLGIPAAGGGTDTRYTATGNWALSTSLGWASAADIACVSPFGGSLVYADNRVNADTFDVYYLTGGGLGTITATATGGTPVVQSTSGSQGWGKLTCVAASAATTNTVTLVGSVGTVHVTGVEPRLSSTKKVIIGNAGVPGSRTSGWTLNPTTFGGIAGIKQYAADLTIINLGINDGTDSVDAATYLANMSQIAAAGQVSGDVLFVSIFPTDTSINSGVNAALEPGYVAALQRSVTPLVDYFNRVGGIAATGSLSTLGLAAGDRVHPTNLGYQDIASSVFGALQGL